MKVNLGFSLIELLIGLTIGSALLSLAVNVYDANHRLYLTNKALTDIFYDGQFIIPLLNSGIGAAGISSHYLVDFNEQLDVAKEAIFIKETPIATALSFPTFPLITSKEGGNKPDQIVINTIGYKGCTGTNFDFDNGQLFHVVNQYYLDGTSLRCKSHDGRFLRGVKHTSKSSYSVALLENVYDLQIQYAVQPRDSEMEMIPTVSWVNADVLSSVTMEQYQIFAVNIALLLGVKSFSTLAKPSKVKMLTSPVSKPVEAMVLKKFETIIVF